MAIKLPDPGNGIPEQKTGNDEWTNMQIVRENFADQSNAASRLVGVTGGQIPSGAQLAESLARNSNIRYSGEDTSSDELPLGQYYVEATTHPNITSGLPFAIPYMHVFNTVSNRKFQIAYPYHSSSGGNIAYRYQSSGGLFSPWYKLYSEANTTKDSATGFLKVSSPVLHVYNDSITKIHEANQLDIKVEKKGVGHYEIHGTTGLRKNDGWNMTPPRDLHGNVLCMIVVTEKDDVVILKTYKRKFDLELAAIVHDWDNPIDIPDGACVEFRFNDLPQEQLDESIE